MRAFLGLAVVGLTAIIAGMAGYQAGVASNVAAAGGVVWLGWGFPGFGLVFVLLLLGALAFSGGRRHRAWGGPRHGAWGGAWGPGGTDDPRLGWMAEAHRRLHEAERGAAPTGSGPDAGTAPGASA